MEIKMMYNPSYRCISLSSCEEKMYTKLMNKGLLDWLENYDIIYETGFKKGNSVLDIILLLKETL